MLIAGSTIDAEAAGTGDDLNGGRVWLLVTILTCGYLLSRGFAKAGSRDPYWGETGDRDWKS